MDDILSPLKSIRAFCLDCVGGSVSEVKLCPSKRCALYPYRFGKDARRKNKERTPAQIAALEKAAERLRKIRENKQD